MLVRVLFFNNEKRSQPFRAILETIESEKLLRFLKIGYKKRAERTNSVENGQWILH